MTRREQFDIILHIILPAIEKEGMTIKTRSGAEVTFLSSDPSVSLFIDNLRVSLSAALSRPSVPHSPYGVL
ncbi:hypothetical protein FRN05_05665 [Salmonella enterica subsp. enterica]|nr:hypothetical protein [Salmonella enterica subsp. enterica serovar Oranienburg]EAU0218251.1 hypothetical protein [Salmonella enterica]EBR0084923.1 hypothetical protein [Salmonella enterica subsp. enterica serovar Wangata]ECH9956529.1 hypothetical protein [Salmonella enterica subsp. enterica]ECK7389131.1 hypothetical protein [Salmonella enterica subsp. enterica serovar Meleagridis]EDM9769359.1 hypothetical protein [Salmonella enterica subsp. enterica serovar Corvallis]EDT5171032.1 hypothetic